MTIKKILHGHYLVHSVPMNGVKKNQLNQPCQENNPNNSDRNFFAGQKQFGIVGWETQDFMV